MFTGDIDIFKKDTTEFSGNGIVTLLPISAVIRAQGINKPKILEVVHTIDNEGRWKEIEQGRYIKCNTPWADNQIWWIYNVVQEKDTITLYAYQKFFADCRETACKDLTNERVTIVEPSNADGQAALTKILANTGYTAHSNITGQHTARYDDKYVTEAMLGDDDNSFVNLWGGELFINNNDVYMNETIGDDNGVIISLDKNVLDFSRDINILDSVTRIIPRGYDGLHLTGKTPWVDSPKIKDYSHVKESFITFSDVKVKDADNENSEGFDTEAEAREELKNRCNAMFTNGADQPHINGEFDIIELSKLDCYKKYGLDQLEKINEGDVIHVKLDKFGIDDAGVRCIGYEWNVLTESNNSVEVGDYQENIFEKQKKLIDESRRVASGFASALNDDGSINANIIKGFLDATQVKYRAQKSIAQTQDIRALLFEDLDPESDTYGAVCLGTQGIMCSTTRNETDTDWVFSSALTSEGLIADKIVGQLLSSLNGSTWINMKDGTFNFANILKFDGTNATFDFTKTGGATTDDLDDAKDDAVTTVRGDYQNSKVTVNGNGVQIKDGALTVTNAQNETVIDGSKRVFQIYMYGGGYLHMDANECSKVISIPHNMNYQPSFHGEFMEYNEGASEERAIHMSPYMKIKDVRVPSIDSDGNSTGFSYYLLPSYFAQMYADTTNLYVKMNRSSDAELSEGWGIYYRYYIYINYNI